MRALGLFAAFVGLVAVAGGCKRKPEVSPSEQVAANAQLFKMVKTENASGIKEWVQRGANVNAVEEDGSTPLHHAAGATNSSKQMVELLIDLGSNVNARDERRQTPLICAASKRNVDAVELLIKAGADVNAADHNDYTPLDCAVALGIPPDPERIRSNINLARLLLASGADVERRNRYGRTVLDSAALDMKALKEWLAPSSIGRARATATLALCREMLELLEKHASKRAAKAPVERRYAPRMPASPKQRSEDYTHNPHPDNPFTQGYRGYCTWYAADRWLWGGNKPVPSTRNAAFWGDDARTKNLHLDSHKPAVGAIVVFGSTPTNRGGHVAYVESVGKQHYTISHMNAGSKLDPQTLRTEYFNKLTKDRLRIGQTRYKGMQVIGFIWPRPKLPVGIKTVSIPIWTRGKNVYRRGLEMRLAEALQKRIELDTPYKVAPKTTADTEIVGRIDVIEQQILSYDTDTGQPREKQITMTISFMWTDLRTGKPILDWDSMRVAGTYRPHEPLNQDFLQGSELVLTRIAKRIVERMEQEQAKTPLPKPSPLPKQPAVEPGRGRLPEPG